MSRFGRHRRFQTIASKPSPTTAWTAVCRRPRLIPPTSDNMIEKAGAISLVAQELDEAFQPETRHHSDVVRLREVPVDPSLSGEARNPRPPWRRRDRRLLLRPHDDRLFAIPLSSITRLSRHPWIGEHLKISDLCAPSWTVWAFEACCRRGFSGWPMRRPVCIARRDHCRFSCCFMHSQFRRPCLSTSYDEHAQRVRPAFVDWMQRGDFGSNPE